MTKAWSPHFLSLLRLMSGLLFMEHGLMKLFEFPGTMAFKANHLPPMILTAGLIEFFGGGLIALGLFTRIAAFLCSGLMAVAYFMAHFPSSFWPATNHGSEAILYCFTFLYLVFAGGGPWSLDALIRKRV